MNTIYFKYFIEVCDCGSIAAAANELYISRQSLTTAINNLESELGNVKLLVRKSSGVEMTAAGKFFYQWAKEQLSALQLTMEQLKQIEKSNILKMGAPLFCIDENHMKEIISFEESNPPFVIECNDMTYRHSRKSLLDGSLDVGLVYRNANDKQDFEYCPVAPADFCILARSDHPVARLEQVEFSHLEGTTLLFVYGLKHLSPEFEKQIIQNNITINCIPRNRAMLVSSLKAGKGLHVLPRLFVGTLESEEIVSRPFKLYSPLKHFSVAYLKDSTGQVAALARHVAKVLISMYKD